jgi:DNA (cytosine-5)-methyltransferase 1
MTRPRLLDLFCGAGGAAMGYHRAGFDVVGVDNRPQPRYPFEFVQADAMTFPLDGFDAIHASPPCQDHSTLLILQEQAHGTGWMLAATRERLRQTGVPWVLENVRGAPMQPHQVICGCVVGLEELERKRWFETWPLLFDLRPPCHHVKAPVDVTGTGGPAGRPKGQRGGIHRKPRNLAHARAVMGIDWMTRPELNQAIPPAYTEYIGAQLLDHLKAAVA